MIPSRPLRVLHITTYDGGGAGVACLRLHRALREINVDSRVLVNKHGPSQAGVFRTGTRWTAALRYRLDRLPLRLYRHRHFFASWSVNWIRIPRPLKFSDWEPDIVHAHWIGDGFVSLQSLAEARKPIVWTMHDMWPFTGGCHYAQGCERYAAGCGACPQLGSRELDDLSLRSASGKTKAWAGIRGVAVSPGAWLGEAARRSAVLRDARIEVIPNGLDGSLFTPDDKREARRALGLQEDERIVVAGAVSAVRDERKGFNLLAEAIRTCKSEGGTDNWRVLVFGAETGPGQETLGIPVTYCGTVRDERQLPHIYRAADVYTLPSLQDNLPNTVVEAMACGTPTVAFRSSGLATMIHDGVTGRLADPFSPQSLGRAIRDVLRRPNDTWRRACREEFERLYAWPRPAQQYLSLYEEMMS